MPKICYTYKRFQAESASIVRIANVILEGYVKQGFDLTLRQLYYQFVARDLFPEDRKFVWRGNKWVRDPDGSKNAEPNYKWLGVIINDARLAGLIDWSYMVDRTRYLRRQATWDDPSMIVGSCAQQFKTDKWSKQYYRPELWVEKDALIGIVEGVAEELNVPCLSCRGYMSASELWSAARRFQGYNQDGQQPIIFHMGDHDPSGVQMTEDINNRLNNVFGVSVEVRRIALTMEQVKQYNPPPNPAKESDVRYRQYANRFGDECWELDALEPTALAELMRESIYGIRDEEQWNLDLDNEQDCRENLKLVADRWTEVVDFVRENE